MKGKVGVRLLSSTTVSTGYDIISFYPPTVLRQGHWRPHMQFCCILIFCIGLPVNRYAKISLWGWETFVLTDTGVWWQLVTRQGQGHVRTPCCLQWGRCQCRGPNCTVKKKNKNKVAFLVSLRIDFLVHAFAPKTLAILRNHLTSTQLHDFDPILLFKHLCTKYHKVLNAIVKVENNICVQIKQKRQMVALWMYLECISARIAKCSQPGFAITEELRLIFPERAGKSWCGWDRNNAKPIWRSNPLAEIGKMRTTLETLRFRPMSYREKMRSVTCKWGCRKKFSQNFE